MVQVPASFIASLLSHEEASIRYQTRLLLLDEPEGSAEMQALREDIRRSPAAQALLAGEFDSHPYKKWLGAHWVLVSLAEIHYPKGNQSLLPLRDQVYQWLDSPDHKKHIRQIEGLTRRCASQEGNALYASLVLRLENDYTAELAENLLAWQWPDGGWNCDRKPAAQHSSFWESCVPLRALCWYNKLHPSQAVADSIQRAAEIFLKRHLFRRQADGSVMQLEFTQLHYPVFWYYDILTGLERMGEAGLLDDPRCAEALDLLEAKQLPDGGFPAEGRFYRLTKPEISGFSKYDWGGVSKRKANPWVSLHALSVLKQAGRLKR